MQPPALYEAGRLPNSSFLVAPRLNTVPRSKSFVLVIIATPNLSANSLAGPRPSSYCKWATPFENGDSCVSKVLTEY